MMPRERPKLRPQPDWIIGHHGQDEDGVLAEAVEHVGEGGVDPDADEGRRDEEQRRGR